MAATDSPQRTANLIYAALLIQDLRDKGFIEGPWRAETEQAHAALKMLVAVDGVKRPSHEEACWYALGMMDATGIDADGEDRRLLGRLLLEHASAEWPA